MKTIQRILCSGLCLVGLSTGAMAVCGTPYSPDGGTTWWCDDQHTGVDSASAQNPSSVQIKVYEFWLSPNDDCSGAIRVVNNPAPVYVDVVNNPTFGSGAIPAGTYRCGYMKMSDQLKVTPSVNRTPCTAGSTVTQDVAAADMPWKIIYPDGSQHNPTNGEDIVYVYFRVKAPTGKDDHNVFDPAYGTPLTAPVVVTGDKVLTTVIDFDGLIGQSIHNPTVACSAQAPTMTMR